MHPADAAELGMADGELARVSSRRGTIVLEARVSHREARGNCFIPFHFREAAANLLTIDEIDPVGKIPEFKFCAVRHRARGAGRADGDGPGPVPGVEARAGSSPARSLIPALQRDPGAARLAAARGTGHAGPGRRGGRCTRSRG